MNIYQHATMLQVDSEAEKMHGKKRLASDRKPHEKQQRSARLCREQRSLDQVHVHTSIAIRVSQFAIFADLGQSWIQNEG